MTIDPPRIVDASSGASPGLRELLQSADADAPSPLQLRGLATRLGPQLGGASAATLAAAKLLALVLAVGVGGGIGLATSPRADAPRATTSGAAMPGVDRSGAAASSASMLGVDRSGAAMSGAAMSGAATSGARSGVDRSGASTSGVERAGVAVSGAATSNATASGAATSSNDTSGATTSGATAPTADSLRADDVPVDASQIDEAALLAQAREALRHGDPRTALALADEHAATVAAPVLAEEREALAIEALLVLGQRDAARRRLAALRGVAPHSVYLPRLEELGR